MSFTSHLPCHRSSGSKHINVLNLRPSAMWFTSENSTAKREDLVVVPTSPRGLYRICYSMHSSYSEIRDLVSYLQPENVFPNVQPVSDGSIEDVQRRLHSFLKHVNSARSEQLVRKTLVQPLGKLKQMYSIQKQQEKHYAESSDELVFSSQESEEQVIKHQSGNSAHVSLSRTEKLKESNSLIQPVRKDSSTDDALTHSTSDSHSSYKGSFPSDKELSFSDIKDGHEVETLQLAQRAEGFCGDQHGDSLHISLSAESEASESPPSGQCSVIPVGDHEKSATSVLPTTHQLDDQSVHSSRRRCAGGQAEGLELAVNQQKISLDNTLDVNYTSGIDPGRQLLKDSNVQQQTGTKIATHSGGSTTVGPASYETMCTSEVDTVTNNCDENYCNQTNSFKDINDSGDSDIIYSSQVSLTAAKLLTNVRTAACSNTSESCDHKTSTSHVHNTSTSHDHKMSASCVHKTSTSGYYKTSASSDYKMSKPCDHSTSISHNHNRPTLHDHNMYTPRNHKTSTPRGPNMSAPCANRKKNESTTGKMKTSPRAVDVENSQETVTVVSSSDDSLNTPDDESQTLWSVSYSVDHFINNCVYSDQVTDTHHSSVPCNNQQHMQVIKYRNDQHHHEYPSMKRKRISNSKESKHHLTHNKRFLSDTKHEECEVIDSVIETNNHVLSDQGAKYTEDTKPSLQGPSLAERRTSICEREKFQGGDSGSDLSQSRCWDADCHNKAAGNVREVSVQNVEISKKLIWIDLTIESSTEIVDLTLEESQ